MSPWAISMPRPGSRTMPAISTMRRWASTRQSPARSRLGRRWTGRIPKPRRAPANEFLAMSVLVLDFGSQVTQLIARRVREAGVYCEIVPYNKAEEALAKKPRAIILSGGPASVYEKGAPRAPEAV